jgi:hypothetical protein
VELHQQGGADVSLRITGAILAASLFVSTTAAAAQQLTAPAQSLSLASLNGVRAAPEVVGNDKLFHGKHHIYLGLIVAAVIIGAILISNAGSPDDRPNSP